MCFGEFVLEGLRKMASFLRIVGGLGYNARACFVIVITIFSGDKMFWATPALFRS
jgi:hypothetical protein